MLRRTIITLICLTVFHTSARGQTSASAGRASRLREVARVEKYCNGLDHYVKLHVKSGRIFANVSSDKKPAWREFKSEEERQEADDGHNLNENAIVWIKEGALVVASCTFQSGSRDWADFVAYYFRPDGTLAKIHAVLNTAYGHMTRVRDQVYGPQGELLRSSTEYRDLHTQKRVKPGAGGEEFIDEPVPVYRRVKDLPFHELLKLNSQRPTKESP